VSNIDADLPAASPRLDPLLALAPGLVLTAGIAALAFALRLIPGVSVRVGTATIIYWKRQSGEAITRCSRKSPTHGRLCINDVSPVRSSARTAIRSSALPDRSNGSNRRFARGLRARARSAASS